MVGYNKHYAYHMQPLYQSNVYRNVATIALYIPPFMFITTGRLRPAITHMSPLSILLFDNCRCFVTQLLNSKIPNFVPTIILDLESLNFEKLLLKHRPIKQYRNTYRYIYMVPVNTKCKYYFTVQFLLNHPIQ